MKWFFDATSSNTHAGTALPHTQLISAATHLTQYSDVIMLVLIMNMVHIEQKFAKSGANLRTMNDAAGGWVHS